MKEISPFSFCLLFLLFPVKEAFSQTWQIVPNSPVTNDRFEDLWFINLNTGWVVEYRGLDRILKTTDGGLNWTVQFSSPDSIPFRSVAFNNAMLGWAGSINGALYKTTNGGDNWMRVDSLISPPAPGFCDMSVVGDSVFIGSGRTGGPTRIIRSTNAGLTFQSIDMSGYTSWMVGNYFKSKDTGWAAGKSNIASEGSVVVYTTNGGTNWTKVYISGQQSEHIWYVLPFNSTTLYGSAQNFAPLSMFYIFTTDNGLSWNRRGPIPGSNGQYAEAIGFVENMTKGWIACGNGQGLFQTTNSGATWTFLNFGRSIHSMQVINDTIVYACGQKIYKYTRGIIGIENEQTSVPEFHILYQNYPNPFNPVTTIHYYLKSRTHVTLQIYTVNGEFISTLVEKFQNAGEYKIEWNALNLPSGVYFYSLMTDEAILSGKALLVK